MFYLLWYTWLKNQSFDRNYFIEIDLLDSILKSFKNYLYSGYQYHHFLYL